MKSEGNRKQISEIDNHPLLKPAGDGWIITENLVSCASVERLGCSKSGWVTGRIIWRASWFFHISRNHHVYIQAHHIFGCRCVFLLLVARDVMFCHVGLLQRSGTLWRLPYAMKTQCKGPLPSQAIEPWGCLMISVEPMDSKPYRAYLYMHIVHLLNIEVLQVTATFSLSGMPSQLEWQVMPWHFFGSFTVVQRFDFTLEKNLYHTFWRFSLPSETQVCNDSPNIQYSFMRCE